MFEKIAKKSINAESFEDFYICSKWQEMKSRHEKRICELIDDYLVRRQNQQKDPVIDFLFEYYAFRPSHLKRWSPGFGVVLEGGSYDEIRLDELRIEQDTAYLDPNELPADRIDAMKWIHRVLMNSQQDRPSFGCLGMHEWAMVYKANKIRHSQVPLRVTIEKLNSFVESKPLICTHFDAFRFFTDEARPLNRFELNRKSFPDTEQPGCIHTNMDLYKWAFKFYPWISSELIRQAFELAVEARIFDMKASPYDLSERGLEPIKIETEEGQKEYIRKQKAIYQKSRPIRSRLIQAYDSLIAATVAMSAG